MGKNGMPTQIMITFTFTYTQNYIYIDNNGNEKKKMWTFNVKTVVFEDGSMDPIWNMDYRC